MTKKEETVEEQRDAVKDSENRGTEERIAISASHKKRKTSRNKSVGLNKSTIRSLRDELETDDSQFFLSNKKILLNVKWPIQLSDQELAQSGDSVYNEGGDWPEDTGISTSVH